MLVEQVERKLTKRAEKSGLVFSLGTSVEASQLRSVESALGLSLPAQVESFYRAHDGLTVEEPALVVFRTQDLKRRGDLLRFATFDGEHHVAFDVGHTNEAGQWDIVCEETGDTITLTMASFLANKIRHWIDHRRRVWLNEVF